jgi:Cyclin, C-terminal domain
MLRSLEAKVCKQLQFRFQRVTPVHFLSLFLRASHACASGKYCQFENVVLRHMCMYILELSRLSIELSVQKPSLIAASSLYMARVTLGLRETNLEHCVDGDRYWTKTLLHYTGYTVSQLKEASLHIHKYFVSAESSETLNASYLKFKKSFYRSVSLKTVPSIECLGFVDNETLPIKSSTGGDLHRVIL